MPPRHKQPKSQGGNNQSQRTWLGDRLDAEIGEAKIGESGISLGNGRRMKCKIAVRTECVQPQAGRNGLLAPAQRSHRQ